LGVAGLGEREPVIVDAFVIEALDLETELEEAVGSGAAGARGLGEQARGGGEVAGDADAFEVEECEVRFGVEVAGG
jgi:hypothetical protein